VSGKPADSVADEWLRIARKDWRRAERNVKDRDPEAAGFFLQQSLEKYLKAFLIKHNWTLRKIHELDALLDEAAKFEGELETYRDLCERVSGYYMAERYPPLSDFELSTAEIRRDLKEPREFVRSMFPKERLPLLRTSPS
jgi:HEPN domain-containing protein